MVGIFVIGLLFLIVLRLFIRSATAIDSQIGLILLGTATLLLLQNKYQHRKYLRVNAYDRGSFTIY